MTGSFAGTSESADAAMGAPPHPDSPGRHAQSAGIGRPALRKEDRRLVLGQGRYCDDFSLPRQAYAAMLRSPHAHARIGAISVDRARSMSGVLAVLTAAEAAQDGLRTIPHNAVLPPPPDAPLTVRGGEKPSTTPHPLLAQDAVRFVGEIVALVVAESLVAAKDACEAIEVRYEPLPAAVSARAAAKPPFPALWHEVACNLALDTEAGDALATTDAFARADHVVRLDTWVQRVTATPMEPRSALATFDPDSGRYALRAPSGNVVRQKRDLAWCLNVSEELIHVLSADIGGNFGTRNPFYPEFALVAWAARRIGRPVKWNAERQEAFLSDYQGRGIGIAAELALDREGNFLALRSENVGDLGAQTVSFTPIAKSAELMTGVYRIPAAHVRAQAVLTNTVPTCSYRSSGRPEAMFAIERLIDKAAHTMRLDRVALRRRNLVPRARMPFTTALGITYDNCAFEAAMDAALELADWDGFGERRAKARQAGRRRGIAIANYVEIASGFPRERAEVRVRPEGIVEITIGTLSSGQGHETSFAQLLTEWLGVPLDCISLITGDTDRIAVGGGSHAGRSMRLAAIVIGNAAAEIVAKGKQIAAHLLGSPGADVAFSDGAFRLAERGSGIGLFEVAAAAESDGAVPGNLRGPLLAISDETARHAGYPYGAQVCEVEIDPETGLVDIVGYCAVDDVGRAINPLIVHGQTHGGIAQGVGQALLERCVFDGESGQPLAGSFMDYAIPRASSLPHLTTEIMEVPAPTNPLGIRSGGEGGTTPALAVAINAVVDALAEFGVEHVEMPATPERVWRAIRDAAGRCSSARTDAPQGVE